MTVYQFGEFELDVGSRLLKKGGLPVRIGARSFDLLAHLVANAGSLVTKADLMKAAWPSTVVDEGSLRVHLVGVRKVLNDGVSPLCIESVAGRGYQFVKPVRKIANDAIPAVTPPGPAAGLPNSIVRLVGRDTFVSECIDLMKRSRVMTLVGPGGIGKTSAAIEIARAIGDEKKEVFFLDLATLDDGALLGPYLATRLGLGVYSDDPMPGVVRTLRETDALLVFDNCEHLIDACASTVQTLIEETLGVSVLATSREPMRVDGERVRQLPALVVPAPEENASSLGSFSAVELFIQRSRLVSDQYDFADEGNWEAAATIVRRMDGIPLAIELAASRVADLGLANLVRSLDDPINILRRGRRTAPPRQQTLRATLDWSYKWLSQGERTLLMHLSVFAGRFREEGARQVSSAALTNDEFSNAFDGLTAKSLVSVSRSDGRFRLLETTREYASAKLLESDYGFACRTAHARFVRDQLLQAQSDWDTTETSAWMSSYGELISDVRSSLKNAFSDGHVNLGLELSTLSGILWTQLGLMSEQLKVVETALGHIDRIGDASPMIETQLRSSHAAILFHVKSIMADDLAIEEFEKAALLAERIGDLTKIVRARSGVCAILTTHGKYAEATDIAYELESRLGVTANGASSRIIGHNAHYLGNHALAREMAQLALDGVAGSVRGTATSGAGYDQKTTALMMLAKTAWIQGMADKAIEFLEEAVAEALAIDHAVSSCLVLATSACPVYFGIGKFDEGRHHLDLLQEIATKHSLLRWQEWARGYELVASPDFLPVATALEADLAATTIGPRLENLCVLGGVASGTRLIDHALSGNAGWCRAELLRLKGEIAYDAGDSSARDIMVAGLTLAIEQSSLLWELRAASSLASHDLAEFGRFERAAVEIALGKFVEPPPHRELELAERLLTS